MSNVTKMPEQQGMKWQAALTRSDKGTTHANVNNAMVFLRHLPEISGVMQLNEFTCATLVTRSPPPLISDGPTLAGPYPRLATEADYTAIQSFLQRRGGVNFTFPVISQAINTMAASQTVHPVREWLSALCWDLEPRLRGWISTVFGCPDDKYHADVGMKFLVAAVSRIYRPGCKFDYVPVFKGAQGIGKSTALRVLFSDDWFKEDLHKDLGSKDAASRLVGAWGVELGELQSMMKSSIEDTKAFLSRQVDKYRPAYGRLEVVRERQCVFAGTTNSDGYLTDSTGNRRFWPVDCEKADVQWLRDNREQLWAEAVHYFRQGKTELYLDDDAVRQMAERKQADNMVVDAWEEPIREWLERRGSLVDEGVTIHEVLAHGVGVTNERMTMAQQRRAGDVLRGLGWEKKAKRVRGKLEKRWFRKDT